MILTNDEIERARAMLAEGFSWSYVRAQFGERFKDHHTFRAEIEPQWREKRVAQRRKRRAQYEEIPRRGSGHKVRSDEATANRHIPENVMRERVERAAALEA